jgi:cytochrome o ubiquinol oxidase operon protein cyoD
MSSDHDVVATQYGTGKKTVKSYVTGLVLSLIFTFLAFWVVTDHSLPTAAIYIALTVFAVLQLIAQMYFFLRMSASNSEARWNLMPFIFIVLIVLILVFGTLWIMYNLNYNMVS